MSDAHRIDLGETPDLDRLVGMSEAARCHLLLTKIDRIGNVLSGHECRLNAHRSRIRQLIGLVITGGSGAVIYLLALAGKKLFGGA